MFRNPRDNADLPPSKAILPSTGRVVTYTDIDAPIPASINEQKPNSTFNGQLPTLGRQGTTPARMKSGGVKQNRSILNFFGKAEKAEDNISDASQGKLFLQGDISATTSPAKSNIFIQSSPASSKHDTEVLRFNERETPSKRRKVDDETTREVLRTPSPEPVFTATPSRNKQLESRLNQSTNIRSRAGFVDESDEEEDWKCGSENHESGKHISSSGLNSEICTSGGINGAGTTFLGSDDEAMIRTAHDSLRTVGGGETDTSSQRKEHESDQMIPSLPHESTSIFAPDEFGEDDEFEDDEFYEDGEEFVERRWMEEQRDMEIGLEDDSRSESATDGPRTPTSGTNDPIEGSTADNESISLCPICNGSMKGLSETQASSHVNACLDGTATPLLKQIEPEPTPKVERGSVPQFPGPAKRFQRAAIARPGQANPFSLANGEYRPQKGSAFMRLMSGHAEDAAWAEAAANEASSRGKPAYQRTCPFYKIMPGFFICVDAFRYGKVEGQNAYFLSHFHSDHYIGLTAQWAHGPIYASKVTCNLMRQQLRVDAKWICPLEFEKQVEVPNTNGVFVTMLPANHCPGSSLFLFEKVTGKNKDGSDKSTRILHCGDFRACPAHVNHPLLKPDVVDAISGQTKQQVIDTCYLDTTYLTPKYSFPSQSDVIDACAQMCVSLAKEIVDFSDSWEKVKLAKAGTAMKKFLEDGKETIKKDEEEESQDTKPVLRGRLLVVMGTYSIGKERICLGIARALQSKIYAPPGKMRICKALEDPDLNALLTSDPLEAQVHMQMLMEIRAETLHDYLITFKGHFHRVVGFRPTGWTYRPPANRFTENPAVSTVLHSDGWKSRYTMKDLVPQRGSTKESNCFGVPYSEHSSFRELTMFCCALRINRVVPTVNVGSAKSRERMKAWIEKWDVEKRKNGLFKVEVGSGGWGSGDGQLRYGV